MLQERNQPGSDRNELLRRDIHVMGLRGFDLHEVTTETARHFLIEERSVLVDRRVRLSDNVALFPIRRKVIDMLGYSPLHDSAIRRFDKPELVNPGKSAHRTDQTDVRSFRSLNRADTSVVRRVNVAHFETGSIPA